MEKPIDKYAYLTIIVKLSSAISAKECSVKTPVTGILLASHNHLVNTNYETRKSDIH